MATVNYREQYSRYSRYFTKLKDTIKQNPQVKESIELLLTLLTISFFIVFALRPTVNTVTELISSINAQKEIEEKLETKLANLTKARQSFASVEQRLEVLEQSLPSNPTPDLYLRQVEGLVATHDLTLKSFNVGETLLYGQPPKKLEEAALKKEAVPGVKETEISLSVTGNFENTLAFLKDLEDLRQMILIDSFSYGISTGVDAGTVHLSVTGGIPNYPQEKEKK